VILKRSREEIHFEIAANRFLHAMIRIIMGRLVDVGRRKVSPEEFAHQLDTEKERRTMVIAPPQGLCLLEISYPRGKAVGERREK
jgi:tRNA pseudouridine38-40 synthase